MPSLDQMKGDSISQNKTLRQKLSTLTESNHQLAARINQMESAKASYGDVMAYIRGESVSDAVRLRSELASRLQLNDELLQERKALENELGEAMNDLEHAEAELAAREAHTAKVH